jgi:RNA polymerase sigma-70 factor (ECF subfamily)
LRFKGNATVTGAELERLYDDHAPALFGYLLSLTRHETDTRDLLQDVFCKIAANPGLLDSVRDPRSFLLRLAHNQMIDSIRRRNAREKINSQLTTDSAELFAPATNPDEDTFRRQVATALAELPSEQRAILHLKLWEGMTFETIAEVLNIPLNTAASRYRYGLDKMRARLRPLYNELK